MKEIWYLPDPARYYIKDYPYYTTAYYPPLTTIPARYQRPLYPSPATSPEVPRKYKCDICDTSFNTEDELSNHVKAQH